MKDEELREVVKALQDHLGIIFIRIYDGSIRVYMKTNDLPKESSEVIL